MVLLLNGSPNRDSKSLSIAKYILKDNTYEVINAYDYNISSCDDCKYCEKKIGCSKKDRMIDIIDLLYKTDTLIVSSPIYFGAFTDKLLTIINRFQRFYGQKFTLKDSSTPKIKTLITITTQGSEKKFMNNGALVTHQILSKLFDVEKDFVVQATNCDISDPLIDNEVIEQIKPIIDVLSK